ncbi:MAG: hypothetical protein ABL927_10420, partial [Bdellovibrionales bacterium]
RGLIAIFSFSVFLTMSFEAVAAVEQVTSREGISSTISADALKGLEDWLNQTKMDLEREYKSIAKMDVSDQEVAYRASIDNVLLTSKDDVEFLTRNILYRAQEMHNLLLTVPQDAKRNAFARRFLKQSVFWAMNLAPLDADAIQKGKVLELAGSPERVRLGLDWASEMVGLSFSLPTSESHSIFLQKVMGFLYNDILQDDRYNRILANTAKQFSIRHALLEQRQPKTPLEHLENAKNIREFLVDEIELAKSSITTDGKPLVSVLAKLPTSKVANNKPVKAVEAEVKVNSDVFEAANVCLNQAEEISNSIDRNNAKVKCFNKYHPIFENFEDCINISNRISNSIYMNNAQWRCFEKFNL